MEKADELIERIMASGDVTGTVANELLRLCFQGYPVLNLQRLLRSEELEVVETGIWIVQELGVQGKPLLQDVSQLLQSSAPRVRYLAMNSVLTCASEEDGGVVARATELISDTDANVRWGVNQFLMRASVEQLKGALRHAEATVEPNASIVRGLHTLIESEGGGDDSILGLVRERDPVLRRFGLAAALRRRQLTEQLDIAVRHSDDAEIRELANEELSSRAARRGS